MNLTIDGVQVEIDDTDAELAQHHWALHKKSRYRYPYRWDAATKTIIYLHREIVERREGRKLTTREIVRHIKGNGLDNRRANLQLIGRKTKPGVTFLPAVGKWKAQKSIGGRVRSLGHFDTEEEAHTAYVRGERKRGNRGRPKRIAPGEWE